MNIIGYLILGIIQGITEPLPISSSGHVIIFKHLINASVLNDLNFEIIINFGSLIAIIYMFRDDILKLIRNGFNYLKTKDKKYKDDFKYIKLLILATIPAGVMGVLFKDKIASILSGVKIIGLGLLITALFLYSIKSIKGRKEDNEIGYKDALVIGLFQALALIPGISRSGSTIVGAMLHDLKRSTALKFSFLLYIPISIAALISGLKDITNLNLWFPYLLGMIASAVMTYFVTKWFMKLMEKGKLMYFVIYCLIVGLLVIFFI
jgi:undecaprenyl-diphosphatase